MPVAKFPTFQQQVHGGEDKGQGNPEPVIRGTYFLP